MKITLRNVRLRYQNLWTPSAFAEGQPLKYGLTVLIEPDSENHKNLEAVIKEIAQEAWKAKAADTLKMIRPIPQQFPLRDGDTKEADGFAGKWFIAAKSAKRVPIMDRDKTPLTEQDGKPYAGCYINVQMDLWANVKNKSIVANLLGVQFVKDGDAFSAGAAFSDDDFDDLSEDFD